MEKSYQECLAHVMELTEEELQSRCQGNTGGCLDPENCGTTIRDFDCGDFEGYCENCREDMEHALHCEMDLFYHRRS